MRDMATSTRATVVCLQETKLQDMDDAVVREALGNDFTANYSFLPARGTRGGILIAVSAQHFSLVSTFVTKNTITVVVRMLDDGAEWSLTSVYGPQRRRRKERFLDELKILKNRVTASWLLAGDFNMIYKASDKNNDRLDRRLMTKFRQMLQELELKEINLQGRKYTWTNGQENPTMTRIDRCFSSIQWEESFPTCHLQALVSTLSDHCPLMLQGATQTNVYSGFRFENYWIHMPGFKEVVSTAWNKPVQATDAFRKLHIKMSRTAKALKQWQRTNIGNIKMQTIVAKEILWQMDVAEE